MTPSHHGVLTWFGFITACAFLLMGIVDGLRAFIKGSRKKLPKPEEAIAPPHRNSDEWDALCSRARAAIEEVIAEMPGEIRAEALEVPYLLEERAEDKGDGYRTLGTYHNFTPGRKSEFKGPIFLYLKTIEEIAAEKNEDFAAKVKTTYLHELGHHFGWDEVDLVRHGLPSGRAPGG